MILNFILPFLSAYLIGSISPSILLGKFLKGIDIREFGSGNAGSTNTFRVLGQKAGFFVMAVDVFKGFFAVKIGFIFAAHTVFSQVTTSIICGLLVICGHIWTIFHSFKGGKGVNTATGVLIGLMPLETLCALIIFIILFLTTGYVSLGSIISSISLPIIMILRNLVFHSPLKIELLIFVGILPVLIIVTHRGNIKRLLNGTENKIPLEKIKGIFKKNKNKSKTKCD